jgi:hypothetical protein
MFFKKKLNINSTKTLIFKEISRSEIETFEIILETLNIF